ncbi:MAG: MBL fold metallo-hydrolase [Azoarcus sp.]|jgi:L-ascorbate metabolism protein UlaG (beta-lactamase superfamily)|nr:MBL fold metallo-hydrolase [Azoarcus sp.]
MLAICFISGSCAVHHDFDEAAWRESTLSRDRNLLYAPHRNENGYFNPWLPVFERKGGFWDLRRSKRVKAPEDLDEAKYNAVENEYDYLAAGADTLSFAGHATFIIQMNGSTIITDPYFSGRAFIILDKVARRFNFEKVPERPVVLISHNHYDHLDEYSVKELVKRKAVFIVPLGLKDFFIKLGVTEIHELDWWQAVVLNDIKYTFLPAQHWSRRIGQPVNSTLWGAFMIEGSKKIFFSGDTGYFVGFKEFGERFPGIDYALLGAGAYEPRWFMYYMHMNVEEFFLAADDLGAKVSIPMHFGVIELGKEPVLYPPYEIDKYMNENPAYMKYKEKVQILRVGEYIMLENRR